MRAGLAVTFLLTTTLVVACNSTPEDLPRRVPPEHTGPFTTWWGEDQVREQGTYRNGQRHGQVKGFHADGTVKFEGDFRDGMAMGDLVQYFPGGAVAVTETVEGGVRQGPRIEYYEEGGRRAEAVFVDGVKHGEETRWHANGVRSGWGRFDVGQPVGRWQFWAEDGSLAFTTDYWVTGGEQVGRLETVYGPEESITAQTLMTMAAEGWAGRVVMWHGNGQRAAFTEYRGQSRHGLDVSWYPSGHKQFEGRYLEDKREGAWQFWDDSGRLLQTVDYDAGQEVEHG